MASLSLAVLLMVVSSASFAHSGGYFQGPVRGYQYSMASRQTQSYDSQNGYQSYSVTSRQCSVIRRYWQYEKINVPFLCHMSSRKMVPMPKYPEATKAWILNAMRAEGWTLCYQSVPVRTVKYHRIPVCCSGTIPTQNGACISVAKAAEMSARMPSPGQVPPGQANRAVPTPRPVQQGYYYRPQTPRGPAVTSPRSIVQLMSRLRGQTVQPGSLIHQVMMSKARQGPAYKTDGVRVVPGPHPRIHPIITSRPSPVPHPHPRAHPMMHGRPNPAANPHMSRPLGTRRPGQDAPGMSDWQKDIARYLATMMYQKLLVEQQHKTLQDEIDRQNRLRQQMEFLIAQQRHMALRPKPQEPEQPDLGQPTLPQPAPNTDPKPVPQPPFEDITTAAPPPAPEVTQAPPTEEEGEKVVQDGPIWNGGILEQMPHPRDPSSTTGPKVFGNGPASIPQGTPPVNPQVELEQMKQKVKGIIDSCLAQSGIDSPMEEIIQSGDINRIRPVCKVSDSMGPCVMEAASPLSDDRMGIVGRQILQSIFMSLGQMCMSVQKADEMSGASVNEQTTPPVFPNSAPSITVTEVTEGTVDPTKPPTKTASPVLKKETPEPAPPANPKRLPVDVHPHHPHHQHSHGDKTKTSAQPSATATQPTGAIVRDPSATLSSAHVQEEKKEVEASFPMWMILAVVGGCAALLFICCLSVCLVLRCRRRRKTVDLNRVPEKLPVPAEVHIYAATPCIPPPAYNTTPVKQSLGGEEEVKGQDDFKIPEDLPEKVAVEEGEEQ